MSWYWIYSALEKYDEATQNLNEVTSRETDPERLSFSISLVLQKFVREKGRKPGKVKEVIGEKDCFYP
jgi:hypothetical protein